MTFSEFGRTSWANDGVGTDHGSAAPHFVFGQNVKGGLYGQRPSLAGLGRWDRMAHHVDFRSYFTSVIDGWLGGGGSEALGGNYADLGLFSGPGAWHRRLAGSLGPAVVTDRRRSCRSLRSGCSIRVMAPAAWYSASSALVSGSPSRSPVSGRSPPRAVAVVANVTAVDVTQTNYFTVYPGSTPPATSNLNARPGRPVPNLVVMGIGSNGCVDVFNSHGTAHCLVDVFGYFTASGGDLVPVSPSRLFDTRTGHGIRAGKVGTAMPIDVQVAGLAGVPPSGATAVVVNLNGDGAGLPGLDELDALG